MSLVGFVFFVIFAALQAGMYLGIRREVLPSGVLISGGVAASFVAALVMSLTSGNPLIQALFVGLLLGLVISGGTVAVALYFHNNATPK